MAVIAPLGDLFESFVKREAGAKDSGRVFGAHGGALDRLDAVIFSVVAGFYVAGADLTRSAAYRARGGVIPADRLPRSAAYRSVAIGAAPTSAHTPRSV